MINEIIKPAASYASFIPFILGLITFKRGQKTIKYLIVLVALACLTESASNWMADHKIPNLFLFHFYTPLELILFLVIYRLQLHPELPSKLFLWIGVSCILLSLMNTIWLQPLHVFNTFGRGLECIVLIYLSIMYLILRIRSKNNFSFKEEPMFWINTAVLIYFPVSMVFLLMSNYLRENFSIEFNSFIWNFHALLSFLQYVLFTIAIYTEWKRTKSPVLS